MRPDLDLLLELTQVPESLFSRMRKENHLAMTFILCQKRQNSVLCYLIKVAVHHFSLYLFLLISNSHCTIFTIKTISCLAIWLVSFLHALPQHRKSTSQLHIFRNSSSYPAKETAARLEFSALSPPQ